MIEFESKLRLREYKYTSNTTMRATVGSDHPFASSEVIRSHYGPLGRTRGANPPDLQFDPRPVHKTAFFLSFSLSSKIVPPFQD
jgi:hypothetical protein